MGYTETIARQLGLRTDQVAAAVHLLDEGNTIPFIARYRKEMTGTWMKSSCARSKSILEKLRALDERRAAILASIEEQGKLTENCASKIQAADTLTALEDLYQPYKPKRRTRASIAREKGLQGLADLILQQARTQGQPGGAWRAVSERAGDHGRGCAGRRARYRRGNDQRPSRGAPADAREGDAVGQRCRREDGRRRRSKAGL